MDNLYPTPLDIVRILFLKGMERFAKSCFRPGRPASPAMSVAPMEARRSPRRQCV
jgi:hypothetical protein